MLDLIETAPVVMHLISSLGIGGAERLLIDTLAATRSDTDVRYVAVIMNDAVDPTFLAQLVATGSPTYQLGRREGHIHPRYLKELRSIMRTHKVEVVHTHNEGSRAWGMLVKLLNPRLRLVYTVHSHDNAASIVGLKRRAYGVLVDATVAISEFVAETAKVLRPRNLTLARNGVDLSRFQAVAHKPGGNTLRVLNVARFIPFKGQDVLIEALAICRARGLGIDCTLMGTVADRAFLQRLRQCVADHDLADCVRFEFDRSDVETMLADADMFVLPSRDEGFGIAIVEAMAAGVPVIASNVGGPGEIIVDGVSGLHFAPGNAADLADKIERLATERGLRQRLIEGGRARAGAYDIRTMAATLDGLYRRLTGRKTLSTAQKA